MKTENNASDTDAKNLPFCTRLKTAREALGLTKKEVAAKLCLSERVVNMMEHDRYAVDLPVTFIRGYIRSYSKLLEIPETEATKGLESIKPKVQQTPILAIKPLPPVHTQNPMMKAFTYCIFFCLISLALMWWFTTPGAPSKLLLDPSQSVTMLVDSENTLREANESALTREKNGLPSDPLASLKGTIALKNNITPIEKTADYSKPVQDLYN